MSAADIEARRAEAVRALEVAEDWDARIADLSHTVLRIDDVGGAIDSMTRHTARGGASVADTAALHALAMLLAAMTEAP